MAVVEVAPCAQAGSGRWACKPQCPTPYVACPQQPVIMFNPTFDGCCAGPTLVVQPPADWSYLCCGDQAHTETPDIHRTCTGGRCRDNIHCGCGGVAGAACAKKPSADDLSHTPGLGELEMKFPQ